MNSTLLYGVVSSIVYNVGGMKRADVERFKSVIIKGKPTYLKICLIQINFVSLYYEN
jgi:hypothetical protein